MIPAPSFYACYDMVKMTPTGCLLKSDTETDFVYVIRTRVLRGADGEPLRWNPEHPDHERNVKVVEANLDAMLSELGKLCPPVPKLAPGAFTTKPAPVPEPVELKARYFFKPAVTV